MPTISCRAKNKKGEPCRAAAGAGGLCHLHANPDFARTLGQQGGRKNRRFNGVDVDVPENMNASDLVALTSRTIGLVLHGELQAREAGAVAQLINVQARIIPLLEHETRIGNLERQLADVLRQPQAIPQPDSEVPIDADRENETTGQMPGSVEEEELESNNCNSEASESQEMATGRDEYHDGEHSEQVAPSEAQSNGANSSEEI
jgi:hypothetical protein